MKEKFMATINEAIDNGTEIFITMESGLNAVSVTVIPTSIDEGSGSVVIYAGTDIFVIDTEMISYDNDEFLFVNKENTSLVTISA